MLVLAVVAVVLCTLGAGTALFAVSNESLAACLLLASIIATTDPMAVIAIFREVGAPRRLSLLVEGESLLNDAAAIALFWPSSPPWSARHRSTSPRSACSSSWSSSAARWWGRLPGGAGLAIGRLDQGGPAEITISVALAPLTYAMADAYFHVSGVVAVVVGGLVFGAVGRTRLASHEWSALTAIWSQLGFWAAPLIFVLASMLVPKTLENVTAMDLLGVAALIVGALGARAATLYGVLPFVTGGRRGNAVDGRYKLVILWGGLRGAVTLALALALSETPGVSPAVQHWVSVLATSFVLFTLLIQATTLRPLLRWLRLDELSAAERPAAAGPGAHACRDPRPAVRRGHRPRAGSEAAFSTPHFPVEPMPEATTSEGMQREHLVSALLTITTRESELYVQEIAERMISRGAGGALIRRSAGLSTRSSSTVCRAIAAPRAISAGAPAGRPWPPSCIAGSRSSARWRSIRPSRGAASRAATRAGGAAVLHGTPDRRPLRATGRDTSKLILETRLNDVERGLDAVRLQYPAYWEQVSAQYLARVAAQLERDGYNRLREERLLSAELFRSLDDAIRHRRQQLERAPPLDLGLEIGALIRRVPVFQGLTEPELASVARLLRPRLALPNERIVRRGEVGNAMYFIASGAVEVALGEERVRLGTGDFFGEMALILRRPRGADVMALGYCSLVELRRDAFRTFLKLRPELMREVRRVAEARLSGEPPGGAAAAERKVQP